MNTPASPARLAITSGDRFAAVALAQSLTYDGPRSVRWAIEYAGQVEGFAHSYPAAEVRAAEDLIYAAAAVARDTAPADALAANLKAAHARFLAVEAQRSHG